MYRTTRRPRMWAFEAKLAILVVLLGLIVVLGVVALNRFSGPRLVYEFHGVDGERTGWFTVKDDWQWELASRMSPQTGHLTSDGSGQGQLYVDPLFYSGVSRGPHYVAEGGRYHLSFANMKGPFRVRVYQLSGRID